MAIAKHLIVLGFAILFRNIRFNRKFEYIVSLNKSLTTKRGIVNTLLLFKVKKKVYIVKNCVQSPYLNTAPTQS